MIIIYVTMVIILVQIIKIFILYIIKYCLEIIYILKLYINYHYLRSKITPEPDI